MQLNRVQSWVGLSHASAASFPADIWVFYISNGGFNMTYISTSTSSTTASTLTTSSGNSTSALKAQIASLEKNIATQEEALDSAATHDEKAEINQALSELRTELAKLESQLASAKAATDQSSAEQPAALLSGESEMIGSSNLTDNIEDTPFGERTAYVWALRPSIGRSFDAG
jgi:uncharacterized coiled-coil protein SlyX